MARLKVNCGNPRLDGEYELDLSKGFNFTKKEWYEIKRRVGVTVSDMEPGAPLDMSVMTALGIIALGRYGKGHLVDLFMETTDEQTDWDWDDSEVEEVEDESLPLKTVSEGSAAVSETNGSSGSDTKQSSGGSPETSQVPTGEQT